MISGECCRARCRYFNRASCRYLNQERCRHADGTNATQGPDCSYLNVGVGNINCVQACISIGGLQRPYVGETLGADTKIETLSAPYSVAYRKPRARLASVCNTLPHISSRFRNIWWPAWRLDSPIPILPYIRTVFPASFLHTPHSDDTPASLSRWITPTVLKVLAVVPSRSLCDFYAISIFGPRRVPRLLASYNLARAQLFKYLTRYLFETPESGEFVLLLDTEKTHAANDIPKVLTEKNKSQVLPTKEVHYLVAGKQMISGFLINCNRLRDQEASGDYVQTISQPTAHGERSNGTTSLVRPSITIAPNHVPIANIF